MKVVILCATIFSSQCSVKEEQACISTQHTVVCLHQIWGDLLAPVGCYDDLMKPTK